jgi:FG-GAP-like repeat/FG-GAP repeat
MSGSSRARVQRHTRRRLWVEPLEDRTLPSFVTAPTFGVGANGGHPVAVAVGDFNRDGKMDVVTANDSGPGISLRLGTGTGSFLLCRNFSTGPSPDAILAADLNHDGKLDVVTANTGNESVTVRLGNGDGTFQLPHTYTIDTNPSINANPAALAVADFNNDGKLDLAVAESGAGVVTILLGKGNGTFTVNGTVAVGSSPTSVAVADFNNDGKMDLATVSGGFGHLDINLGHGDGTFDAPVNYTTGFVAKTVVVGDFNGDHQPDLAVGCGFPSGDGISILLGNPDGTFQPFTDFPVNQNPADLAVADMNGDGIQDLVTADGQFDNNSVAVLTGVGDGTFGPARVFTAGGQSPVAVAVADFNSDGRPDVVTADSKGDTGTIALYRGNGDGTLQAAPALVVPGGAGQIAAADVNGDGIPDLAVSSSGHVTVFLGNGNGSFGNPMPTPSINGPGAVVIRNLNPGVDQFPDLIVSTGSGINILLGNGDGTFGTPTVLAAGTSPNWVAVDDFNNDGKLDLAVAEDSNSAGVYILLGNGDGTFGTATPVSAGGNSSFLLTGDFNKDGKRDLAVLNGGAVSILLGRGDGTFGAPKFYTTAVDPGSIAAGDFNRDGRTDLAVPTFFGDNRHHNLATMRGTASGAFVTAPGYSTDTLPIGIVAADLTGDGKLDLAVVNKFSDDVCLFPGLGDGTFGAKKTYVVGSFPEWAASADLNMDGKLDLLVTNGASGTITLLETPTPTVALHMNVVPTTTTAGAAFKVVVTALDAAGHIATNFTGTVRFTSSDGKAVLPLAYTFTAADFGVKRFNVTLKTAGTQNVTVQSGGFVGTDSVAVVAATASHLGFAAPATATAGVAVDATVTALDPFGNVATGYLGTVRFTSSASPLADLPPNYTFQAGDNGVKTFQVTLKKSGPQTVTVRDTVRLLTLVKTASVTVAAGPASVFFVSGFPLSTLAGAAHTFTVTARDDFGNTVTNYVGTVQFSSSDTGAALPGQYTFTTADKGHHTFTATFHSTGSNQSLTVTDMADALLTGTETGINVT